MIVFLGKVLVGVILASIVLLITAEIILTITDEVNRVFRKTPSR